MIGFPISLVASLNSREFFAWFLLPEDVDFLQECFPKNAVEYTVAQPNINTTLTSLNLQNLRQKRYTAKNNLAAAVIKSLCPKNFECVLDQINHESKLADLIKSLRIDQKVFEERYPDQIERNILMQRLKSFYKTKISNKKSQYKKKILSQKS